MSVDSVLVVTGHFPPNRGGVEVFSAELAAGLTRWANVLVMAPDAAEAAAIDRALPMGVVRYPAGEQRTTRFRTRVLDLVRVHRPDAVWLTSGMPLGWLAAPLRRAGVPRIVVSTHGMEAGWASVRPAAVLMRRFLRDVDVLTYLGEEMHRALRPALPPGLATARLAGGVDAARFAPAAARPDLADGLGLGDRPVVVTASRLVRRKGQDVLLAAWPQVRRQYPRAALLVVGSGPRDRALRRTARRTLDDAVVFSGSLADEDLASYLALARVFALPCRDVWCGLQREGLGLSILEASSVGLPVVVGRSGGSPDAVIDGVTGRLVSGEDPSALAATIAELLGDPAGARRMGAAGRRWVCEQWSWDVAAAQLWQQLDAGDRCPV